MITRRKTSTLSVGKIKIGSKHPISIQSMCNTKTSDVESTVNQIQSLVAEGCQIVRLAVPDLCSAEAIKQIKKEISSSIPLVADIHFDHKLAIAAMNSGVDSLRLNPGNIGSAQNIKEVVSIAQELHIPIRVGVNSGSIAKHILQKHGVTAEAIVESAMEHIHILEDLNLDQIKISVKASSVNLTIDAYRLLAEKTNYPFHLGVTEAGTEFSGTIKSAIGIGTLLAEGIGDTIRVSLTDDPVKEIKVAKAILKSLDIRKGLEVVSCPTCGRTEIPLLKLVQEVEKRLAKYEHIPITVAVMGCVVNGVGESREADYGIAGGKGEGLLFQKGKVLKKVKSEHLVDELIYIIETDIKKENL